MAAWIVLEGRSVNLPAPLPTCSPRASSSTPDARIRWLVDHFYSEVVRAARQFGISGTDAEDVAQRVFLLASRKLDQILPGSERAFLFGTAIRVAGDVRRSAVVRREIVHEEIDPSQTGANTDSIVDQLKAREMLDQLIESMPEDLRPVFILYEMEEMTAAQISSALNLPAGTVASRLRRSREWFQRAVTSLTG